MDYKTSNLHSYLIFHFQNTHSSYITTIISNDNNQTYDVILGLTD